MVCPQIHSSARMGAPMRQRAMEGMDETDLTPLMKDKIDGKIIDDLLSTDRSKREVGTGGFFGKHFLGLTRDSSKIDPQTRSQLEAADDLLHRFVTFRYRSDDIFDNLEEFYCINYLDMTD